MIEDRQMPGGNWVKETGFGEWFLGTDTWVVRVLEIAMDDLESLISF